MGVTTSITFTPGLVNAAVNTDVITLVSAVNHVGGYPIGTTTMTVDGFPSAVTTGQSFTLNGQGLYTITAHTETTGKTTSITFMPPLGMSTPDNAALEIQGNVVEVKIGEGTLTYSEKRGVVYVLNRGKIYTVKLGDDAPVEVSLQFIWEFLRAGVGDPPTVEEAIKNIGAAAGWVSSSPDACEPYSVDIIIANIPPCPGEAETIILNYFRWETLDHDLKAGQVATKGNCNIAFAEVIHEG